MFTGLVQAMGEIEAISGTAPVRFGVRTPWAAEDIPLGASISHAGCCLTVVERRDGWHAVEVSGETLRVTTLGDWRVGDGVNLERSLRLGDELGGHLVTGHVDGLGVVQSVTEADGYWHLRIEAPADLAACIAVKGSITVDGVSLTVNAVDGPLFGVAIIPQTHAVTSLGRLRAGDRVNLEIDLLARYLARQLEMRA